jgi:hypothetical protein
MLRAGLNHGLLFAVFHAGSSWGSHRQRPPSFERFERTLGCIGSVTLSRHAQPIRRGPSTRTIPSSRVRYVAAERIGATGDRWDRGRAGACVSDGIHLIGEGG